MPNFNIFHSDNKHSRNFVLYAILTILAGLFVGYIEWGTDWEVLPIYAGISFLLYFLIRFIYSLLPKQEFLLALGGAGCGLTFGLIEWGLDIEELIPLVISGLFIYLTGRFLYHLMSLGLNKIENTPPIVQAESDIVVYLTLSLRERARKLKISSRFILLAILISITGGIQLFYSADNIARLNNGEYQLGTLVRDFDRIVNGGYRFSRSNEKISDQDLNVFLDKVKKITESETNRYIQNSKLDPKEIIISTLTTRIGTIFFLLFFVQILVSLYRYSMKLAALYDGRADILQLLPSDVNLDLDKLVKLTSTDSIDFTKQEKAPADYALELAKKIIDKSEK